MRIVTLCATRRGLLFIKKLMALAPNFEHVVFSFREEAWEPPYLAEIQQFSQANQALFIEAKNLTGRALQDFWESTLVDLMLVVNWRYMIPTSIYNLPRLGTFVFHDSLLPAYRGFSPTMWAIINGEHHTGVTLFEIAEGVDEGDIVDQQKVPIEPNDTIKNVLQSVTQAYLDLLERNFKGLVEGAAPRLPQDHSLATYTCKWRPDDFVIEWSSSTEEIYNLVRALTHPYPGAYTYLLGKKLYIWKAKRIGARRYVGRIPGKVVEICAGEGTVILTGDSGLLVTKVQLEGEEVLSATEVLNRYSYTLGR